MREWHGDYGLDAGLSTMYPSSVSTSSWSGLVLIVASSLVACGEGKGEGMTDPPDGEETPELRKVTFMTYNIYGAGGVTPDGEEREEDHDYGVADERLFLVLDVIKAYDADVVGLQEVWWSAEDTVYANGRTTADSVSTLTGMYHWVERGEGAPTATPDSSPGIPSLGGSISNRTSLADIS